MLFASRCNSVRICVALDLEFRYSRSVIGSLIQKFNKLITIKIMINSSMLPTQRKFDEFSGQETVKKTMEIFTELLAQMYIDD